MKVFKAILLTISVIIASIILGDGIIVAMSYFPVTIISNIGGGLLIFLIVALFRMFFEWLEEKK